MENEKYSQCQVCGTLTDSKGVEYSLFYETVNSEKLYSISEFKHCPDCKQLIDSGYIALIEVNNPIDPKGGRMLNAKADRTGQIGWLKKEMFNQVFATDITSPSMFVEKGMLDIIQDNEYKLTKP